MDLLKDFFTIQFKSHKKSSHNFELKKCVIVLNKNTKYGHSVPPEK